jgi:DNA-binding transcriptional LysR family regulator
VGGNRLTGGDLNGATQLLAYPTGIAQRHRKHPDIDFVLHDRPQQWVLESIRQGEVDFGIVIDPGPAVLQDQSLIL